MTIDVKVPEVGESVHEVEIGKWLKGEGDAVEKDEILVEIETDKATQELPAPADGVLKSIKKKQGDSASVGDVIAELEEGQGREKKPKQSKKKKPEEDPAEPADEPKPTDDEPAEESEPAEQSEPAEESEQAEESEPEKKQAPPPGGPRVMPAAQRVLAQHGMSASDVPPSGPGGRVLKEDAQRAVRGNGNRAGAGDGEEVVRMSLLRRRVASALVDAQRTAALLTTFNEVDMSGVMALRKQHGESFKERYGPKLGLMSFFVKAAIEALKEFPALNAEVRDDSIVYRNRYDIGIAVSAEKGLVVPVLRHAERMSFAEVEQAINELAEAARENKLAVDDLAGGTFTITNGGVFGSLLSTPIVNPPQSGILGMHTIQQRPVAVDGQVVIRPMMYLAVTYDHRIIDGREAVLFLRKIKDLVEQPARMLIEV